MHLKTSRLMILVLVAVLAGCSSKGGTGDGAAVEDRGTEAEGGAYASGAAEGTGIGGYSLDDPNSPLARRVIYFEYDSAEIAYEDQDLLLAHAGYLAANPTTHVTLEGHADERGSREYNIGLGDRRAQSVQRVLELNGVPVAQISIVSYGEEKPAAEGHSETAWRLNRRVELVY
ncbi:MAG: peptidoglycan-associated lipoprotein Pal [Gammaproteobacteria bacterium]|jgi:peptidoglycan-associated lipoprotein